MAAEPTPGPWSVEDRTGYWYIYGPDNLQIHNRFNAGHSSPETAEANRRLIEAAPDLLQVCRDILSDRESYDAELTVKRANQLRTALAKAEGEGTR